MRFTFLKSAAILTLGIVLGVVAAATPVAAQLTASAAPSLKQLKKIFYTKGSANKRFATKQQLNSALGNYYTQSEIDTKLGDYYTKSDVDTKLGGYYTKTEIDAKLHNVLTVVTANGVGNDLGCASGTLAVGITDANAAPVDDRFTFQVPGAPEAYGQIRSDGSIRSSSANVTSVDHTTGTGVYCIHFTAAPTQDQLESAVVSLHDN